MYTIEINEEVESKEDMVFLLEEIARKVRGGFTSGHEPNWELNFLEAEPKPERSIEDEMDDDSDNLSSEETY